MSSDRAVRKHQRAGQSVSPYMSDFYPALQDPEEFIANGGWNFLDLEGGSDEEDGEEEVIPISITSDVCHFHHLLSQAVLPKPMASSATKTFAKP